MRVGTKLLVLVLLPTCALVAFASVAAIRDMRAADRLREFHSATRLSVGSADAAEALANERTAVALGRLGVRSADRPRITAARRTVDAALRRAAPAPGEHAPVDVAGRLGTARRRLDALRARAATGSLGSNEIVEDYGVIARGLLGIVRDLDSGRPSRATGSAADAYVSLVQAVEGADMERATQAAALVRGTQAVRVRGVVVEANALDDFRQNAARGLVAELDALRSEPADATVQHVRDVMVRDPARVRRQVSLRQWLAASATRLRALRRLQRESAAELDTTTSAGLGAARASVRREVAGSLVVLILVAGLGLVLRRSITRPLEEVSDGARKLSAGEPVSVTYAGRDEIGEVAASFRDLQVTTERLAEEIRAMNVAVEDNRLTHRAEVAAFDGGWAELMGGINDTMAAFGELQGRRERAERDADRIFDLSLDLLCIAGFDGYYKRVNPAFERMLGYPTEILLSRPTREFIHPDDRAARDDGHARLEAGDDVLRFELRQLCSGGSVRRVEWSARVMRQERLIYAVGRDVTDVRRAADEQTALRRVATLVAKGVVPSEIFAAVTREVGRLCDADVARMERFEPDGTVMAIAAWAADERAQLATDTRIALDGASIAAQVRQTGRPARIDSFVGATGPIAREAQALGIRASVGCPITVDGRLWGVIAASTMRHQPFPADTEARLVRFTDLVATAIANAESRAEVAASRARVVTAAAEERRRVVRDLHDGAQQRLVHTVLTLELACQAQAEGDSEAAALLAEALQHAQDATQDVRELSHGILPAALTTGGLPVAVETLISRMPVPVATDVSVARLPPVAEATAYFVLAEALTNVVKHAGATHADVRVALEDTTLRIAVRDDGDGGARPDGSGLTGLRDRLEALDGRLRIDSPPGRGTLLMAEIPLSGHPPAHDEPRPRSATPAET
jgi:PAS domain S-box-containing protein